VRRILGDDGQEKLQLRIDLGVIQMNATGRPDGLKPHGCESLLVYHQQRARKKADAGSTPYTLSAEECSELQQEGIQYYHRYVSLFQLQDYAGVIRDTQRNLDLFAFVAEHAEQEEMAWSLEQFRPYVLMMNTRAKASIEIERKDVAAAIREMEAGRKRILDFYEETNNAELASKSPEIAFLDEWVEELREKKPVSKLELMQREMEKAIATESYERAAQLRDAINAYRTRKG
jgi:hypothetical protein